MRGFSVALAALLLSSCAEMSIPKPNAGGTGCGPGVAQIAIQDGLTQVLCGCNEPAAGPIVPPATLTCTVESGTTLFFQFIANRAFHQVVPVGTPFFAPSTLERRERVHAVIFSTPGSYQFQDSIDNRLTGVIVVQ
jgi:hypothetical protein